MNNNEIKLNYEIQCIHKDLYNIENSLEYKVGKKVTKCKIFKLLYKIRKKFSKKIPEEKKIYNMYVTNDVYPNSKAKKIVVYSCITGNYDNVIDPLYCNENIDYILFTNNKKIKSSKWKVVYVESDKYDNVLFNRYIKMHPFEYLKEYDYSIYIDGNIKIFTDISCFVEKINNRYGIALSTHSSRIKLSDEAKACKKLKKGNIEEINICLQKYSSLGMPDDYGLLEAPIIVTNLNNEKAKEIFNDWWNEFYNSNTYRDQIHLPFVLWQKKIKIDEIGTISNNIWLDAKLEKVKHNKG